MKRFGYWVFKKRIKISIVDARHTKTDDNELKPMTIGHPSHYSVLNFSNDQRKFTIIITVLKGRSRFVHFSVIPISQMFLFF